jgi:hypothetical protein
MLIPRSCAALGLGIFTSFPLYIIRPESFEYIPANTFTKVDFPAPFSPTKACTSPFFNSKRHFLSAFTPGKDLSFPPSKAIIHPLFILTIKNLIL